MFDADQLIRLPGRDTFVSVAMSKATPDGGCDVVVAGPDGLERHELRADELASVETLSSDGEAASEDVLAALWSEWMAAAATNTDGAAMISSQLTPYPHQHQAVYGTMLPQPMLRFVLGDEPGTGKTIMGGLAARELQRLGMVNRCLVVCPAHLVTKWQADFERFFGGGLLRVENDTVKTGALRSRMAGGDGFWVVSLELAAMNTAVLEALHPDNAGWGSRDLRRGSPAHPDGRVVLRRRHRAGPSAAVSAHDGHPAPGERAAVSLAHARRRPAALPRGPKGRTLRRAAGAAGHPLPAPAQGGAQGTRWPGAVSAPVRLQRRGAALGGRVPVLPAGDGAGRHLLPRRRARSRPDGLRQAHRLVAPRAANDPSPPARPDERSAGAGRPARRECGRPARRRPVGRAARGRASHRVQECPGGEVRHQADPRPARGPTSTGSARTRRARRSGSRWWTGVWSPRGSSPKASASSSCSPSTPTPPTGWSSSLPPRATRRVATPGATRTPSETRSATISWPASSKSLCPPTPATRESICSRPRCS